RSAVAPVREQESTLCRRAAFRQWRGEPDVERDAGEMRVGRRCRGQWRERRICVVYGVTEPAREREAEAIASGSGNGEPATRHDDSVGPDAGAILEGHEPALTLSHDVDDAGTEAEARARAASDGKQSVAHITGTVAPREQLPVSGSRSSGMPSSVSKNERCSS